MPAFSEPQVGRRIWQARVLLLAALLPLAGCGTFNTDFAEVRPSLVGDNIHDWVGTAAVKQEGGVPSKFGLTDDERAMRDLAFPLIEPPYDRQRWDQILYEYGQVGYYRNGSFDRDAYAYHLFHSDHRSPSSLYSTLTDDIRNDITRMPHFFETASRVVDVDAKREQSLAYIAELSPWEKANAARRVRENAAVLAWVRDSLANRITAYRFALERMVISTPSPQAADIERLLNRMRAELDAYRQLPPAFAVRRASAY